MEGSMILDTLVISKAINRMSKNHPDGILIREGNPGAVLHQDPLTAFEIEENMCQAAGIINQGSLAFAGKI